MAQMKCLGEISCFILTKKNGGFGVHKGQIFKNVPKKSGEKNPKDLKSIWDQHLLNNLYSNISIIEVIKKLF